MILHWLLYLIESLNSYLFKQHYTYYIKVYTISSCIATSLGEIII